MSRSLSSAPSSAALPLLRAARPWIGAALGLGLAVGAGLLLTRLLMSPPSRDLRIMGGYLSVAGAGTLLGGWLALLLVDRVLGLPVRGKAFVGAAISGGVALLNVVIVAELMFVSTSHDLKLLVALVSFSAAVTTIFSVSVASTIAGRIERVAQGIARLAAGVHDEPLQLGGGDEVARLSGHVNRLADRLREAEARRQAIDQERRELTAAISHDLRTPLASVRAMIEALADGVVCDRAEIDRYYATMRREIERLNRMIDDLFELAQLDAGVLRLKKERVSLQEIAAEVVDTMLPQARQCEVELRLRVSGSPPELLLDGDRMERAVSNLVRNALEHTLPGDSVELLVAVEEDWVALRVIDSGEGIGTRDLPRIWDRFYRAEGSRGRPSDAGDGAGLGLAIVRGFVEAHGGQVEAFSRPRQGAQFTVRLPFP